MKKSKQTKVATGPAAGTEPVSFLKHRYTAPVLLALVVLVGLYLRTVNLSYVSLWGDELNHVFAGKSLVDNGKLLLPSGQEYHLAALYTYMTALASWMAGAGEFSNRFVSVAFGLLTVIMVYLLGVRLYGSKKTALLAALLVAVGPWYIFRSRIVRFYTMFQFLYTAFAYLFYLGFETGTASPGADKDAAPVRFAGWLARERIRPLYLVLSFVLLWMCIKLQALAFEAGPSIMAYALVLFIMSVKSRGGLAVRSSKYAVVVYAAVAGAVLAPVILSRFSHSPFKVYFISWEYYTGRMSTEPFWAFRKYFIDTLWHLHPWVWVMGMVGIVMTFVSFSKQRLYILALFIIPFIIQAFVVVHPNSVKSHYLFFAFPFFVLMTADGLTASAGLIAGRRKQWGNAVLLALAALFFWAPVKKSLQSVNSRVHGDLKDMSTERYANWRDGCAYVETHLKTGDVVISTQPWSVIYYLKKADYYIRTGFNEKMFLREGYDSIPNFTRNHNAPVWPLTDLYAGASFLRDYNSYRWTMERFPRGWLIACHKLFNPAFTDKRILADIKRSMRTRYVDKDQSVVVYSWDRPEPVTDTLLTVTAAPQQYRFPFSDPRRISGMLRLQLDVAGVTGEFLKGVTLNGGNALEFRSVKSGRRQIIEADISREQLKKGNNTLVIPGSGNAGKTVIYHIGMTIKQGQVDYSIF